MLLDTALAFPDTLLYSDIDVVSEVFLKKVFIYFDKLQLISTSSSSAYETSPTARAFQENGFLVPLMINAEEEEHLAVSQDVLVNLNTPIGRSFLIKNEDRSLNPNFERIQRAVTTITDIHPNELPEEIRNLLSRMASSSQDDTGWLQVNDSFTHFYMTLLANRLSERLTIPLISPFPFANRLAWLAKLDAPVKNKGIYPEPLRELHYASAYKEYGLTSSLERALTIGHLVECSINMIMPKPDTSIQVLNEFKQKHYDELSYLCTKINQLRSLVQLGLPTEELQERLSTFTYSLSLAFSDLKHALNDSGINWTDSRPLKMYFLSDDLSGLAGLPVGIHRFASRDDEPKTLSISSIGVLYNVQKWMIDQKNTGSYLW